MDAVEERRQTLYINSPGGSVIAGLALYDTMQHVKSPVATVRSGPGTRRSGIEEY